MVGSETNPEVRGVLMYLGNEIDCARRHFHVVPIRLETSVGGMIVHGQLKLLERRIFC